MRHVRMSPRANRLTPHRSVLAHLCLAAASIFNARTQEATMSSTEDSKRIRLERRSPFYWRVTFDHPPLNIFGPESIPQLNEVVTALETDDRVKVVVFDSAVE